MSDELYIKKLESLFLCLADQTRLRILNLIRSDELSVNQLVEILNEAQPKISRHLAYLRNAGLVSTRRDGKWIYYRLTESDDAALNLIFSDLLFAFEQDPKLKNERTQFTELGTQNIQNTLRNEELETFLL